MRVITSIPEPGLIGPAQVLATDSKCFTRVYGIDYAKAAGLTKQKLKNIGVELMKMPVRIEWQTGYATENIGAE